MRTATTAQVECNADDPAQQFLSSLDDDPQIGRLIDQTMEFEYEQEQMLRTAGQDLSPEMWIMK
jgi:hypothetical protein